MPADVSFLFGRADTGKSEYITARLERHLAAGERALLLVPEQFTFETERRLTERFGGLVGVQVLSFDRLAERILSLAGRTKPFLDRQGLAMIVRRAAYRGADELAAFSAVARQPGFAGQIADLIARMKGEGIAPGALEQAADRLGRGTLLFEKLRDLAILYRETDAYLAERYITAEDALNAAVALFPSSFAAGLPVYVDGFEGAKRAVYALTKAMFTHCPSVALALRADAENPGEDVFAPDRAALESLTALAGDCGCRVLTKPFSEPRSRRTAEAMFLERHLFSAGNPEFPEPTDRVTVFSALNRESEAEAAADAILALHSSGARFLDVSVLLSDMDAYAEPLLSALERRGVPAFLDRRDRLRDHACSRFLLSSLRAASGGPIADALAAVKSGFLPISCDEAELFENYILRYGIKPGQLWKPFVRGEAPPEAERARAALIAALTPLRAGLAAPAASQKARAAYAFLTTNRVNEALRSDIDALRQSGDIRAMETSAQVWNAIMALFSQLDAVMGDVRMDREQFVSIVEEGMAGGEIGAVPAVRDSVLVGDCDRTRTRPVLHLFVLGCNEGLLPREFPDDALLDDAELALLAESGLPVWEGTSFDAAVDRLNLYGAFSRAHDSVTVSFSRTQNGEELAASALAERLLTLFPLCRRTDDIAGAADLPRSVPAALNALSAQLSAWKTDGEAPAALPSLAAALSALPETKAKAARMRMAAENDPSPPNLPARLASLLYGRQLRMSASRLEQFNACPFRHFAAHGLAARERPTYREKVSDLGTFYHDALEAFLKACLAEQLDFSAMTAADADRVMDDILPGVLAAHNGGFLAEDERQKASLFLIVECAKQSARALTAHLAAGAFTPLGAEVRFGENEAFPPIPLALSDGRGALLSGVIDRIDASAGGRAPAMRVIDYKTFGRAFDFAQIANGLSLQLPLYLAAVEAAGGRAAGLYYMPLLVPPPNDGEDPAAQLEKAFRLRGLTLADPEIFERTERNLDGPSRVVHNLRRKSDGSVSGLVCDDEAMRALLAEARRIAAASAERMLSGDIAAKPTQGACEYCEYRGCCRFDPELPACRARRVRPLGAREFFELIGGGAHAMDE